MGAADARRSGRLPAACSGVYRREMRPRGPLACCSPSGRSSAKSWAGIARTPLGSRVRTLRDPLAGGSARRHRSRLCRRCPFTSLYLLGDEFAAEIANQTVHGVLHLGWVPDGTGGYRGQLAVLVKPNGLLGTGYLAAIMPFRRLAVYPLMMRNLARQWRDRPAQPAARS